MKENILLNWLFLYLKHLFGISVLQFLCYLPADIHSTDMFPLANIGWYINQAVVLLHCCHYTSDLETLFHVYESLLGYYQSDQV